MSRTLTARFRIGGLLRFLSHAETLRVFQRACARAGVPVKYTMGFNPHPKLSLPLPRTVGVESDDELVSVRLAGDPQNADAGGTARGAYAGRMRQALQEMLPADIEVLDVEIVESGASFHARSADYVFSFRPDLAAGLADRVRRRTDAVMAGESLIVKRRLPADPTARRIDVRPFLQSIQPADERVTVRCNVTAAGSVRIDEIMQLLELKMEDLAAPIRRTAVEWVST